MEEDVQDKKLPYLLSPQPCFPKLASLFVDQCQNLKGLFSVSASNDLPNLEALIINGATELEELIGCEQGKGDEIGKAKVEFSKLKLLIFMHLSTLRQGTEFMTVKHRFVHNCPKLSLASTSTLQELYENFPYSDFENTTEPSRWNLSGLIDQLIESDEFSTISGTSELPSSQVDEKSEKGFIGNVPGSEVLLLDTATSTNSELNGRSSPSPLDICQCGTHSHELVDGQSTGGSYLTDQQNPLGETESIIGIPQNTEDIGKEIIQEGPVSEGLRIKTMPTVIEGIGLGGGVATHTESSGEDILAQDSQVVVEQDDKLNEGKTGTMPCQEIQIEERLNLTNKQDGIDIVSNKIIAVSPDTRTRLEAYKQFVDMDDAQIALLVDAIATYPHLWNACEKFSERFQAWLLKTLADILFLRNENADSVTPQREKEFHKLCDEAAELGFDRSWVDEMRQRVVARDPKLEEDQAQAQIHDLFKRSTGAYVVSDSKVFEQGDRQIEHSRGTSPRQKIPNVDKSIKEGSNLIDKESEIGVVSNDHIVAPRNEEPEKEFVAKESTSEIQEIATPLTNTQLVEGHLLVIWISK
ncbi:uncharacterized protein LOC114915039 [Cajanus cajan]|uniref:uncharacterized protein LOC114915039 n=1 Tax=Cajanus cajan TaxID=3821 RepID=UPI0010FB1119|nr:uncharacterized protein LOC114915039 [Cajanus cajan]XP_029124860.1 uncharacterized protein LOC114915039 [Cajanus cajan]